MKYRISTDVRTLTDFITFWSHAAILLSTSCLKWPPFRHPRVREVVWLRIEKMSKRGPNEASTSSGPSAKKGKSDHVLEMGLVSGQDEFDLKVLKPVVAAGPP